MFGFKIFQKDNSNGKNALDWSMIDLEIELLKNKDNNLYSRKIKSIENIPPKKRYYNNCNDSTKKN